MWIITKDTLEDGKHVGKRSQDHVEGSSLGFRFRMMDADGEVYYHGLSDDDSSFAPLDDFGLLNAGCTDIQYWNEDMKKWETI